MNENEEAILSRGTEVDHAAIDRVVAWVASARRDALLREPMPEEVDLRINGHRVDVPRQPNTPLPDEERGPVGARYTVPGWVRERRRR